MHAHEFEEDKVPDYDVLLALYDSVELWTEPIHITNASSVDGTVLVPAGVGKAIKQLCTEHSRPVTRSLWEWSACYDHDDAFEAAYYAGSYLLSVYGRAATVYVWIPGLTSIAGMVRQWMSEAASALKAAAQTGITPTEAQQRLPRALNEEQDRALQTLFSHTALRNPKTWLALMVADKRDLPIFFLGEYGLINGREVKTAYELLEGNLVASPSRELMQAILLVKAAKEKAINIIFDISPTIPIRTIHRTGNAKHTQHSIEESTVQPKRYLVGTENPVQGGRGFMYKIITPGHGRKATMCEKINDWEVFQANNRRPDSWSSSDDDMFPELQGRTLQSYTQYRSVTGTRQRWTEMTDTEITY